MCMKEHKDEKKKMTQSGSRKMINKFTSVSIPVAGSSSETAT